MGVVTGGRARRGQPERRARWGAASAAAGNLRVLSSSAWILAQVHRPGDMVACLVPQMKKEKLGENVMAKSTKPHALRCYTFAPKCFTQDSHENKGC